MGEVMAPGPGGSPFRARWNATSVSLYSVVNEPGGLFFLSPFIPHFFSGLIALQWELFSGKVLSSCIPHFFQILQPVGGNFFSGKVPLTLYSTLFSRLDEKIIKLFCGKTVGTLSTLLIESEKHLSRNLFSDKEKAEKENRIG